MSRWGEVEHKRRGTPPNPRGFDRGGVARGSGSAASPSFGASLDCGWRGGGSHREGVSEGKWDLSDAWESVIMERSYGTRHFTY